MSNSVARNYGLDKLATIAKEVDEKRLKLEMQGVPDNLPAHKSDLQEEEQNAFKDMVDSRQTLEEKELAILFEPVAQSPVALKACDARDEAEREWTKAVVRWTVCQRKLELISTGKKYGQDPYIGKDVILDTIKKAQDEKNRIENSMRSESYTHRQQLQQNKELIKILREEKLNLEAENQRLVSKCSELNQQIDALRKEVDKLKGENGALNAKVVQQDAMFNDFVKKIQGIASPNQ
jgi:predicted nuclease with TOPRIM domain